MKPNWKHVKYGMMFIVFWALTPESFRFWVLPGVAAAFIWPPFGPDRTDL